MSSKMVVGNGMTPQKRRSPKYLALWQCSCLAKSKCGKFEGEGRFWHGECVGCTTAMAQKTPCINVEQIRARIDHRCEECIRLHVDPLPLSFGEEEGNTDESALHDRPQVLSEHVHAPEDPLECGTGISFEGSRDGGERIHEP